MKHLLALSIILISISAFCQKLPKESASKDSLKRYITFLASDSLKGRGTGTEEQRVAAEYIAAKFESYGLSAPDNSYYQRLEMIQMPVSHAGKFKVRGGKQVLYNYNDIVAVVGKKIENTVLTVYDGEVDSLKGATNAIKVLCASSIEEAFVLLQQQTTPLEQNYLISLPSKKYVELIHSRILLGSMLIKNTDANGDVILKSSMVSPFSAKKSIYYSTVFPFISEHKNLNLFFTDSFVLKKLISQNNLQPTVGKEIEILGTLTPDRLDNITVSNVVGYMEGTDLKDELVIVSAHYDHLGIKQDAAKDKKADLIFNGADDNASGTATVLELARLFGAQKENGSSNRRSVLFTAFTGEELGLVGSNYMVENPIFSDKKIYAVVNIDMVGRSNKGHTDNDMYVYTLPLVNSQIFEEPLKAAAKKAKITVPEVVPENEKSKWIMGSDHYPFVKNGIPALVLTTGEHPDYHTVEDEVQKINFSRLTRIVNFSFLTTWQILNQ